MTRAMFVWLTLLTSTSAFAEADLDGRMAIRTIYATDDGPIDKTVFINFLDADVDATGLGPFDTRIVLDSTFMFDATQVAEHRFGATESMQRVRQLYVGQSAFGDRFHVNIGRRIIPETGNAWFDGVELLARLSRGWRLGAYGGLKPEPHSFYPSAEQQVAGSFATFRQDGLSSDLGYNVVLRDGLDRQFVFSRVHYRPFSKFYLSTYLTADLLDDPDVTTLLATVDYTPIKPVNLSINFSRYSIEKYRDTQIYRSVIEPNQALILGDEVINLVYNRVRFNLSYRFWRRFYHYQSLEYKVRSQDNLESWSFIFGLRASRLLQNALSVDVRTVVRNNFQSDSWLLALDAEYELTPGMFAQLRTTYFDGRSIDRFTERGRTFDQAQDILLVGGGLFWLPAKEHHLSVHYDGVYEMGIEDSRNQGSLLIHTLMTRYGYYF